MQDGLALAPAFGDLAHGLVGLVQDGSFTQDLTMVLTSCA